MLAGLLALAACGEGPPGAAGPDGETGPASQGGAPDRVLVPPPGGSFVGRLPAPGSEAPAAPTGSLTAPWTASFVGTSAGSSPAVGAPVQVQGGTFALAAAGAGLAIAATEDEFLFVHRTLAGDGALVGLLRAVEGCDRGRVSFGPMIRAGTDADAAYVLSAGSGAGAGTALQARPVLGLVTSILRVDAAVSPPLWLKVERVGTRVRAGYSSDGTHWTEAESFVHDLGHEAQIGLVGTSHRETPCRGLFESVEVIGAGN